MPRNRQRKSRKSRGNQFKKAPLQGVGETQNWMINDIAPVVIPANSPDTLTFKLACDCNGWSWVVTSGTTAPVVVSASQATASYRQTLYGQNNSQFTRLAGLWNEYRLNSVEMEWCPTMGGGQVNMTTAVSLVDETGKLQDNTAYLDLVEGLSSQRNVQINSPYSRLKKRFNYSPWLGQCLPNPWLLTQQSSTPQIIRERYPVDSFIEANPPISRCPAIVAAGALNNTGTSAAILGIVRFRAHYTFRTRQLLDSDPFADQTLLYEKDGLDYKVSLTKDEVNALMKSRSQTSSALESKHPTQLTGSQLRDLADQIFNQPRTKEVEESKR